MPRGASKQQHACLWPGFVWEVKFLSPSQLAGFGLQGNVCFSAIYVATGFWRLLQEDPGLLCSDLTLHDRRWAGAGAGGWKPPFPTTIGPSVSSVQVLQKHWEIADLVQKAETLHSVLGNGRIMTWLWQMKG